MSTDFMPESSSRSVSGRALLFLAVAFLAIFSATGVAHAAEGTDMGDMDMGDMDMGDMDMGDMDMGDMDMGDMDMGDMDMGSDDDMDMGDMEMTGVERQTDMASMDMSSVMSYDSGDLYNKINTVAYPLTILLTLFVGYVSFRLIKLTHQTDKFTLVAIGMAFLFIQAVIGTLFYVSQADIVSMRTVMFWGGLLTSLSMASIGAGFYRWMRMLK